MTGNIEEDADGGHQKGNGGAACAEKRQRKTGRWENAHHHADVDKGLYRDHGGNARRQQTTVAILTVQGNTHSRHGKGHEKQKSLSGYGR